MDRQWRVALISEHASPAALLGSEDAGGQNVYVDAVSRGLAERGYAVDVFTRRDDPRLPTIHPWADGVRIINVTAGPPRHLPKDALWAHMAAFRDACVRFARAGGLRYDVLHGNFWMSGWVLTELQRIWGIPGAQIFHATGVTKQRHQGSADTSPDARIAVEMGIVRGAAALIAQCPAERDELLTDYGADPHKIALIPGAVDTRLFRPEDRMKARAHIGLPTAAPLIVYVGRILPRKDIRNILRALALLGAVGDQMPELVVVGGDPHPASEAAREMAHLRALAGELGLSARLHFVGQQQPNALRHYYSAGDVVVTTPWYEPFGLTPLEAMACARPIIGSAVGGLTHTIVAGKTGMLVPPRAPDALAAALRDLLAQPDLRAQMGRAGLRRVRRNFTWPLVAMRTDALFQGLLARQGASPAWVPLANGHMALPPLLLEGDALGEADLGAR